MYVDTNKKVNIQTKKITPGILPVGNGINRAFEENDNSFVPEVENWNFEGMSRKNIIEQLLFNYGNTDVKYEDISNLPMSMQIITATKDNVDKAMSALSKSMISEVISAEKENFCKKLLSLPVSDIITTNYSYELDLWWLACCKKRRFPNTKIYYYTDKTAVNKGFELLLKSYNIEICNNISVKNNNYIEFYEKAIVDIEKKLKEGTEK